MVGPWGLAPKTYEKPESTESFDNDRPSNEKLSFEIYAYTFDVCGSKSVVIPRLITALVVEAVEPALR